MNFRSILIATLLASSVPAYAVDVECTKFTPEVALQPGQHTVSPEIDTFGWDYYQVFVSWDHMSEIPPLRVTTFHGEDMSFHNHEYGFASKRYDGDDFVGIAQDEYRLNTSAEWITKDTVRVQIQNMSQFAQPIAHASVCMARILPPKRAGVSTDLATTVTGLVLAFGLFLGFRGKQARCMA